MGVVARTSVSPDYSKYLYYTKGNDVYSYNKASKAKKVVAKNAFSRKAGYGYVLKKAPGGLVVVENSLAALRSKRGKGKKAKTKKAKAKKTSKK